MQLSHEAKHELLQECQTLLGVAVSEEAKEVRTRIREEIAEMNPDQQEATLANFAEILQERVPTLKPAGINYWVRQVRQAYCCESPLP